MTFIEAFKTGKMIKRLVWDDYHYDFYHCDSPLDSESYFFSENRRVAKLRPDDLMADDWHVKGDDFEKDRLNQIEKDSYNKALNLIIKTIKKELNDT